MNISVYFGNVIKAKWYILNFQATADIIENIPLSIRDRYTLCMSPADSRLPFTRIMLLRVRWKQIFTTEHLRVGHHIKISKNWPLEQKVPGFKKKCSHSQTVHFRGRSINSFQIWRQNRSFWLEQKVPHSHQKCTWIYRSFTLVEVWGRVEDVKIRILPSSERPQLSRRWKALLKIDFKTVNTVLSQTFSGCLHEPG